MSVQMFSELFELTFDFVLAVGGILFTFYLIPFFKNTVVPWLDDKRILSLCQMAVEAVEKMAQSGQIDKHFKMDEAIAFLESKGVMVTPEVRVMIESCVMKLDLAMDSTILWLAGALDGDDDEPEDVDETVVEADE